MNRYWKCIDIKNASKLQLDKIYKSNKEKSRPGYIEIQNQDYWVNRFIEVQEWEYDIQNIIDKWIFNNDKILSFKDIKPHFKEEIISYSIYRNIPGSSWEEKALYIFELYQKKIGKIPEKIIKKEIITLKNIDRVFKNNFDRDDLDDIVEFIKKEYVI